MAIEKMIEVTLIDHPDQPTGRKASVLPSEVANVQDLGTHRLLYVASLGHVVAVTDTYDSLMSALRTRAGR